MKLSKVNNTRSAVSKNDTDQKTSGILYPFPGSSRITVNGQFDRLNRTAQILYHVFNPINVGTGPQKPDEGAPEYRLARYEAKKKNFATRAGYSKLVEQANRAVDAVLFRRVGKNRVLQSDLNSVLDSMKHTSIRIDRETAERLEIPVDAGARGDWRGFEISISRKMAEDLVVLALRRSLRKYAAQVETLLVNLGRTNIEDGCGESIRILMEAVREDYEKSAVKERLVRAVQNQNMPVQPDAENGRTIALSMPTQTQKDGKETRKAREKRGEKRFLSLYADLDERKRADLLRRLRRLVDLFFWGPEGYNPAEDFNVWEQHERGKSREGLFVAWSPEMKILEDAENGTVDLIGKKQALLALQEAIRTAIKEGYRRALPEIEARPGLFFDADSAMNDFWIHHIEDTAERILALMVKRVKDGEGGKQLYKLQNSYLCEKVWKTVLSYISTKYIAVGKAVFHYGVNQIDEVEETLAKGGEITLGEAAVDGNIASFDYEMIKASETMQRETAVCVAFAAHNLQRAVMKDPDSGEAGKSADLLAINPDKLADWLSAEDEQDAVRQVLQFFGGCSKWDSEAILGLYKNPGERDARLGCGKQLIYDVSRSIFAQRNKSFHFTTAADATGINSPLFVLLFEQETERAIAGQKEKFYSNNLPLFYATEKLKSTFRALYSRVAPRGAQIPAFSRIVARMGFPDYVRQDLGVNISGTFSDSEKRDQWYSAAYFLLKEIYYNAFMLEGDWIKAQLDGATGRELRRIEVGITEAEHEKERAANKMEAADKLKKLEGEKRAVRSFKERYDQLKISMTFSQICQAIMTDYNLQNSGTRKGKSGDRATWDPGIYNHYRTLLYKFIREVFFRYIHEKFDYIWAPGLCAMPSKEDFVASMNDPVDPYRDLKERVRQSVDLQTWYVTCRFMNARTLNLLAGTLRSYVQFVREIIKRAKITRNKLIRSEADRADAVENQYLKIVELCIVNSSNYSENLLDYFRNDEAYAEYLSTYVDFYTEGGASALAQLDLFCNDPRGTRLGTFMDGKAPILNRNVVMSKLFGPARILGRTVKKITAEDFEELARLQAENRNYFSRGLCANRKEQETLLRYQRLVNRIELRNIAEFGEIINELLGQLVNWSYLRERDLLYFQLGFHYTCLKSRPADKLPEAYRSITEAGTLHSAILYQLIAMYVNGYPVRGEWNEDKGKYEKTSKTTTIGAKVTRFEKYAKAIWPMDSLGHSMYYAGLEVFENVSDHEAMAKLRNSIDHFYYYTGSVGSILDLYSEIFDRFFSYDMKFAKNVANMLENILLRHFAVADIAFTSREGSGDAADSNAKKRARITVTQLASDSFTYKLQGGQKPINLPARDREYLDTLVRILYYPGEAPEGLVRERKQPSGQERKERQRGAANVPKASAPPVPDPVGANEPDAELDMETAMQNLLRSPLGSKVRIKGMDKRKK